jgi:mannose-6-phosphate isomerase-like protein (cupin superfamily)
MRRVALDQSNDLGRLLLSAVQPDLMPGHAKTIQRFRYRAPTLAPGKSKAIARLCTTDMVYAAIQKIEEGGESDMHLHAAMDGFWFVLDGYALFTFENGVEHRLAPYEGLCIPRGTFYGFRKDGPAPLILLQVEALNSRARKNPIRYKGATRGELAQAKAIRKIDLFDARVEG